MEPPKLSIPKQIEHMRNVKGITFELCKESDAKRFLEYNNYYYKLKAYAHNYDKYREGDKKGQYINLDFAYLKDLSTIDANLRKVILSMSMDLEHFLKVKMLADFNKVDEDGYEIIEEFFKRQPDCRETIEEKSNTSTCHGIIKKYSNRWAIWSIIELMSFGQFIGLYNLFYERNDFDDVNLDLLFPVKMLRNAAAHNNCLINQLRPPYSRTIAPSYKLKNEVVKLTSIKKDLVEKRLRHPTVHDFVALLFLYNEIVPEPTRSRGMAEVLKLFTERMPRNKEYYQKEQVLLVNYKFVKSIVTKLCEKLHIDN